MTDQTQLDASFGGFISDAFRNRGRRGVLIGATIAYWIVIFAITAPFIVMAFAAFGDYFGWITSAAQLNQRAAPEMPPSSVFSLIPLLFLYMIVVFLVSAAYEASCLRWLVRGETSGLLGLTFGADMWRVWFCYWMWLALFLGAYLACLVPIAMVTAVSSVANNEALGVALAIILGVAGACVAIWIAVRLAPATAATVALKRFAFFEAWTATQGRFWVLFGAFFLLLVIYTVLTQALQAVGGLAFMTPLYSSLATSAGTPDPEALVAAIFESFSSPALWIGLAILIAGSLVIDTLFRLAMFGVSARAVLVARQDGRI